MEMRRERRMLALIAAIIALLAVGCGGKSGATVPVIDGGDNGGNGGNGGIACVSGDPRDRANPCVIVTVQQLQAIKDDPAGHYALGGNIDASSTRSWHGGEGFDPIGKDEFGRDDIEFTGSFDGRGHKITGLYIKRIDAYGPVGLFGFVGQQGVVHDVKLVDVYVFGNIGTGGLAGFNKGSIRDAYVAGEVAGPMTLGGLVGTNLGSVTRSHASVDIRESGVAAGGLVGLNYESIVESSSTGAIDGGWEIGGLVGRVATGGLIERSFSTGTVNGERNVGGLVGAVSTDATIANSYSTSAVSGSDEGVGGLIGYVSQDGVTVAYSYSTGRVKGTFAGTEAVGGLIGHVWNGVQVVSSYWDTQSSGQGTSAGGAGKTTVQMRQQATFVGWDFGGVWTIDPGMDYPDLVDNPRP